MNKKELEAFAKQAAKSIKTEADLTDFRRMLTKVTVEAALNAELDEHLGYAKNEQSDSSNARNGYSSKTIRTEDGEVYLVNGVRVTFILPPLKAFQLSLVSYYCL